MESKGYVLKRSTLYFDKNETNTEEKEGVRRIDKIKEEESKVPSLSQSRRWNGNEEVAKVVPHVLFSINLIKRRKLNASNTSQM